MSHERKTIAVSKDIADKLADIAKSEGMTLFSLLNEILETAIQSYEAKLGKVSEIFRYYQDFMVAKDIGMIFCPLKVENLVHKLAFQSKDKDKLIKEWYNYGKWIANYTTIRFPKRELEMIDRVSQNIFWTRTEIEIKKFPEDKPPQEIEVRIFGQDLDIEFLEGITSAYEGIFNELNFKTLEKKVSEGICLIKLKK